MQARSFSDFSRRRQRSFIPTVSVPASLTSTIDNTRSPSLNVTSTGSAPARMVCGIRLGCARDSLRRQPLIQQQMQQQQQQQQSSRFPLSISVLDTVDEPWAVDQFRYQVTRSNVMNFDAPLKTHGPIRPPESDLSDSDCSQSQKPRSNSFSINCHKKAGLRAQRESGSGQCRTKHSEIDAPVKTKEPISVSRIRRTVDTDGGKHSAFSQGKSSRTAPGVGAKSTIRQLSSESQIKKGTHTTKRPRDPKFVRAELKKSVPTTIAEKPETVHSSEKLILPSGSHERIQYASPTSHQEPRHSSSNHQPEHSLGNASKMGAEEISIEGTVATDCLSLTKSKPEPSIQRQLQEPPSTDMAGKAEVNSNNADPTTIDTYHMVSSVKPQEEASGLQAAVHSLPGIGTFIRNTKSWLMSQLELGTAGNNSNSESKPSSVNHPRDLTASDTEKATHRKTLPEEVDSSLYPNQHPEVCHELLQMFLQVITTLQAQANTDVNTTEDGTEEKSDSCVPTFADTKSICSSQSKEEGLQTLRSEESRVTSKADRSKLMPRSRKNSESDSKHVGGSLTDCPSQSREKMGKACRTKTRKSTSPSPTRAPNASPRKGAAKQRSMYNDDCSTHEPVTRHRTVASPKIKVSPKIKDSPKANTSPKIKLSAKTEGGANPTIAGSKSAKKTVIVAKKSSNTRAASDVQNTGKSVRTGSPLRKKMPATRISPPGGNKRNAKTKPETHNKDTNQQNYLEWQEQTRRGQGATSHQKLSEIMTPQFIEFLKTKITLIKNDLPRKLEGEHDQKPLSFKSTRNLNSKTAEQLVTEIKERTTSGGDWHHQQKDTAGFISLLQAPCAANSDEPARYKGLVHLPENSQAPAPAQVPESQQLSIEGSAKNVNDLQIGYVEICNQKLSQKDEAVINVCDNGYPTKANNHQPYVIRPDNAPQSTFSHHVLSSPNSSLMSEYDQDTSLQDLRVSQEPGVDKEIAAKCGLVDDEQTYWIRFLQPENDQHRKLSSQVCNVEINQPRLRNEQTQSCSTSATTVHENSPMRKTSNEDDDKSKRDDEASKRDNANLSTRLGFGDWSLQNDKVSTQIHLSHKDLIYPSSRHRVSKYLDNFFSTFSETSSEGSNTCSFFDKISKSHTFPEKSSKKCSYPDKSSKDHTLPDRSTSSEDLGAAEQRVSERKGITLSDLASDIAAKSHKHHCHHYHHHHTHKTLDFSRSPSCYRRPGTASLIAGSESSSDVTRPSSHHRFPQRYEGDHCCSRDRDRCGKRYPQLLVPPHDLSLASRDRPWINCETSSSDTRIRKQAEPNDLDHLVTPGWDRLTGRGCCSKHRHASQGEHHLVRHRNCKRHRHCHCTRGCQKRRQISTRYLLSLLGELSSTEQDTEASSELPEPGSDHEKRLVDMLKRIVSHSCPSSEDEKPGTVEAGLTRVDRLAQLKVNYDSSSMWSEENLSYSVPEVTDGDRAQVEGLLSQDDILYKLPPSIAVNSNGNKSSYSHEAKTSPNAASLLLMAAQTENGQQLVLDEQLSSMRQRYTSVNKIAKQQLDTIEHQWGKKDTAEQVSLFAARDISAEIKKFICGDAQTTSSSECTEDVVEEKAVFNLPAASKTENECATRGYLIPRIAETPASQEKGANPGGAEVLLESSLVDPHGLAGRNIRDQKLVDNILVNGQLVSRNNEDGGSSMMPATCDGNSVLKNGGVDTDAVRGFSCNNRKKTCGDAIGVYNPPCCKFNANSRTGKSELGIRSIIRDVEEKDAGWPSLPPDQPLDLSLKRAANNGPRAVVCNPSNQETDSSKAILGSLNSVTEQELEIIPDESHFMAATTKSAQSNRDDQAESICSHCGERSEGKLPARSTSSLTEGLSVLDSLSKAYTDCDSSYQTEEAFRSKRVQARVIAADAANNTEGIPDDRHFCRLCEALQHWTRNSAVGVPVDTVENSACTKRSGALYVLIPPGCDARPVLDLVKMSDHTGIAELSHENREVGTCELVTDTSRDHVEEGGTSGQNLSTSSGLEYKCSTPCPEWEIQVGSKLREDIMEEGANKRSRSSACCQSCTSVTSAPAASCTIHDVSQMSEICVCGTPQPQLSDLDQSPTAACLPDNRSLLNKTDTCLCKQFAEAAEVCSVKAKYEKEDEEEATEQQSVFKHNCLISTPFGHFYFLRPPEVNERQERNSQYNATLPGDAARPDSWNYDDPESGASVSNPPRSNQQLEQALARLRELWWDRVKVSTSSTATTESSLDEKSGTETVRSSCGTRGSSSESQPEPTTSLSQDADTDLLLTAQLPSDSRHSLSPEPDQAESLSRMDSYHSCNSSFGS